MKYSLRRLFLLVTAVAGLLWVFRVLTHVEYGENEASVWWLRLPPSATNISYSKSYSFTAYEFEIPEADFVKWSRWKLSPIRDLLEVPRYRRKSKVPDFGSNPTPQQLQIRWEALSAQKVTIANGLYFTYRNKAHGGEIVAYDRDRGKAFIWTAPR
jgi:hypothetical protein